MIKRDSRGHLYSIVRGEILGFIEDKLLRKHLPRMFSLIRNESQGIEDDYLVVYSGVYALLVCSAGDTVKLRGPPKGSTTPAAEKSGTVVTVLGMKGTAWKWTIRSQALQAFA
jgi:hypothetical protein